MYMNFSHVEGAMRGGSSRGSRVSLAPNGGAAGEFKAHRGPGPIPLLHLFTPSAPLDWSEEFKGKRLRYNGEIAVAAERMTLEQILPGLPPRGLTGKVRALDLAAPALHGVL